MQLRNILRATVCTVFGLLVASCQSDETVSVPDEGNGQPLEIAATTLASQLTRASSGPVPAGEVTTGVYYFSYPYEKTDGTYECRVLPCYFSSDEKVGRVYSSDGRALEWTNTYLPKSSYCFILDNVEGNVDYLGEYSSTDLIFSYATTKLDEKYKAMLQTEDCTNDIVWGKSGTVKKPTSSTTSPVVSFELKHCMAQTYVAFSKDIFKYITQNEDGNDEDIDLTNANITVEITNIITQPEAFNRSSGVMDMPSEENSTYESFTLVDNQPVSSLATEEIETDGNAATYYVTPKLILPPQTLADGTSRPRLRVTFNGKTFSGALPAGMVYTSSKVGAETEFCQNTCLQLRVSALKEKIDELEIQFLPVYVRDWYEIKTLEVHAPQAGVYSQDDLTAAIEAYNNLVNDDYTEIYKYGCMRYKTSDTDMKSPTYVVNLFTNVTAPSTRFKQKDGLPIDIDLNGYTVSDKSGTEAKSLLIE